MGLRASRRHAPRTPEVVPTPYPVPTRYFQGREVTGLVHASSAASFKDVVEKMTVCPTLPFTRKTFFALTKAERSQRKHVPYFVAACFKNSPCARVHENALHCNLVFLDLDENKDGTCPAAPFVRDPQLLYQALEGLNFAAHTTASSTPEKPRMRIVVDCHEIPLSEYPKAVRYVASLLGILEVTRESLVPTQPMFLPTLFRDDTEESHPMLANFTDAKPMRREAYLGIDLPEPQKNGSTPHHTPTLDDLDFLRAPLPEITLAIAKDALSHINPDCSYHEWLEVAACLKHQFTPLEADEAYELFDEWSQGGTKYVSSDETRAKWDSLRQTPGGREPRTIRSLLRLAALAGWDDTRLKEDGYSKLVEWMGSVPTVTQMLEQGVRKILATPQLSSTQEGMLLDQLRVHAKDRFAYRASITDLRKDLAALRDKQKPDEQEKKKVPKWATGLCLVTVPGVIYRQSTGEKYKPDAFNMKNARHLLPTAKALVAAGIPVNESTLSKPLVPPMDYVLNYIQIPTFYDFAYDPSQPNEMLFVHEKKKYVNTYSPTYPEMDMERAAEAGAILQRHLDNLISEPEYRTILLDFMAYIVQFPGRKIRWAALIQGVEGAGKTYFAKVMKAVLGERHVRTVDGETITSGWNEWTFGYQMVAIEEVRVAGTNRFDIMNRLKPWITNDDIPINQRFHDNREVQNITNYMLFSNHHDCLTLTPGDRRYFVIKSALQTKQQVLSLGKDYFARLFGFLETHPGAMRAFLHNWKISEDFNSNSQAPRTKYVQDLIEDSASEVTAAVRRIIGEGDVPLAQYDIVSAKAIADILQLEVGMKPVSSQHLGHVLREEGYHQIGRHSVDGDRHYLWVRRGVDELAAPAEAAKRSKENLRNLCMDLLF